jgi:hypothetical protein
MLLLKIDNCQQISERSLGEGGGGMLLLQQNHTTYTENEPYGSDSCVSGSPRDFGWLGLP